LQAATDAQITLGTGGNAVTVTRDSNTISDLLPNLTLTLKAAAPATPVTVTVSTNNTDIQQNVERFVKAYNDAVDFINLSSAFDLDTKKNGALVGDFTLQNIQNDLGNLVVGTVDGLTSSPNTFSDVGLTLDSAGKLEFDASTFNQVLVNNPTGAAAVFARTTQTSDQAVTFVSAGSSTKATSSGYAVNVTQIATKAQLTAGVAINNTLAAQETLTVNGVGITLTAGSDLAAVLAAINARSDETGVSAAGTDATGAGSGNFVTLTATNFGSGAKITAVSDLTNGGAQTGGFGNVTVTESLPQGEGGLGAGAAGLDVAGTLNGETANGLGQFLTGASGNANTAGLQVQITAAAPGALGTVKIFDGLAKQLDAALANITNVSDGVIQTQVNSLQTDFDDLQDTIDRTNEAISRQGDRLRKQFAAMEAAVAQLQSQQSSLQNALSALNKSN